MRTLQTSILVFIIWGTALALNPFFTTEVFEFPKLMVLFVGVAILTLVNGMDASRLPPQTWQGFSYKKIPVELWFLGLFLLGHVIAFLFSTDRHVSLAGTPDRYQGFLTQVHYVLLALNSFYVFYRAREENTITIVRSFVVLLFVVCVLAISPYFFTDASPLLFPFYFFTPSFFQNRVFGTFGNPNYLAAFMIALFPFALLAWKRALLARIGRFLFWPCILLVSLALFLTGSRSAWIAILSAFLFLGVLEMWKNKNGKTLAVTGMVILLVFAGVVARNALVSIAPSFNRLQLDTKTSTSFSSRLILWRVGLQMAVERPLTGFGHDRLENNIEPYLPETLQSNRVFYVDRTHNELIDIFAMHGIVTLIGYVGLLLTIWLKSIKAFLQDRSPNAPFLAAALVGLTSLTLFHAVNFSTISSWVLLAVLLGYVSSRTWQLSRS
jgi:O-antigen ligase